MSRSLTSSTYISAKQYSTSIAQMLAPVSQDRIYTHITQSTKNLIGGEDASLFVYKKGSMQRVSTTNKLLINVIPRKNGLTMQVYKEGKVRTRSASVLRKAHPFFEKVSVVWDVTIPLICGKKTYGVISVIFSTADTTLPKKIAILRSFSPIIAYQLYARRKYQEIQQKVSQKELLLSLSAHELKIPLTALQLYAHMLTQKNTCKKMQLQQVHQKIWQQIKKMRYVVEEILHIRQTQNGIMPCSLVSCSLTNIINQAVDLFKDIYPERKVTVINTLIYGKDMVYADAQNLELALGNIVNNAIKYSHGEEKVDIIISEKERYFVIDVQDYGNGIYPQDMKKIFTKFYQGKNADKHGLGLGLYLVKQIVRQHKGKITVDSVIHEGTTVRVFLPKEQS